MAERRRKTESCSVCRETITNRRLRESNHAFYSCCINRYLQNVTTVRCVVDTSGQGHRDQLVSRGLRDWNLSSIGWSLAFKSKGGEWKYEVHDGRKAVETPAPES